MILETFLLYVGGLILGAIIYSITKENSDYDGKEYVKRYWQLFTTVWPLGVLVLIVKGGKLAFDTCKEILDEK